MGCVTQFAGESPVSGVWHSGLSLDQKFRVDCINLTDMYMISVIVSFEHSLADVSFQKKDGWFLCLFFDLLD